MEADEAVICRQRPAETGCVAKRSVWMSPRPLINIVIVLNVNGE